MFAVYDTAGQLVTAAPATTVFGDTPTPVEDLNDVAETLADAYPGFEVCVWRDVDTVIPRRRCHATPDAVADRR